MALFSLHNPVMILIFPRLYECSDIICSIRVSKRRSHLFDDCQCASNVRHQRCNALFWAAKCGCEIAMHKTIHLEANTDTIYAGANHDILNIRSCKI